MNYIISINRDDTWKTFQNTPDITHATKYNTIFVNITSANLLSIPFDVNYRERERELKEIFADIQRRKSAPFFLLHEGASVSAQLSEASLLFLREPCQHERKNSSFHSNTQTGGYLATRVNFYKIIARCLRPRA